MFAVLYRWRLKPGSEEAFRQAWRSATASIQARYGTGGSRLHRTDDGELVAYAVWPSREDWARARGEPSANPEASDKMRACVEQSFPATLLEVADDLLQPLPA